MTLMDLLETIADELPGCELTSVVSFDSGLSLASVSPASHDDAAAADAFHCELYRLLGKALTEAGSSSPIDDVVVRGAKRTFISTPLAQSGYFWHVCTKTETTLGFTQAVMRKYREDILAGIRGLIAEA